MFAAKLRLYYKAGNAKPKHKDVIDQVDMQRLGRYFERYVNCPQVVVEALWFCLCYNFGRRGREGWAALKKDSFVVSVDSEGVEYVNQRLTETTKNNQGGHKQSDQDYSDVRMYGFGVDIFKYCLDHLHPGSNRLFLYPTAAYVRDEDPFFMAKPMGKTPLGKMMQQISSRAKLSKIYTCHSVRASTISHLFQNGISAQQITQITKHKNQSSLNHYISDMSVGQKKSCSAILNKHMPSSSASLSSTATVQAAALAIPEPAQATADLVSKLFEIHPKIL